MGSLLRTDWPLEVVADDDPKKEYKMDKQRYMEERREREAYYLSNAEGILRDLEEYLGKGERLGVPDESEMLYEIRCMFHPLQHATRKQP